MADDSDDEIIPTLVSPQDISSTAAISKVIDPKRVDTEGKRIPVSILTGFLGSGKSTLLNYILTSNHGKRIAVIENEFGEGLGVETMIAKSGVSGDDLSNFFELPNGCICCTIKDDLLTTLEQLVSHKDSFEYIIIETTGLANPGPVISVFWTDDELDSCLYLDGVVCVVDSLNISAYLQSEDIAADVRQQICYADRILLNKSDLVQPNKMDEIQSLVGGINALARIERSSFSAVSLDFVLNIGCYPTVHGSTVNKEDSLDVVFPNAALFMQCTPCAPPDSKLNLPVNTNNNKELRPALPESVFNVPNRHIANDIKTKSIKIAGKFKLNILQRLLDGLLYSGIVMENDTSNEKNHTVAASQFKTVDEGDKKLFSQHNQIADNAQQRQEIYRMKAVVHIENSSLIHIVQAVHNIFEVRPSAYHAGDPGDKSDGFNLFVFIGKNLDVSYLEAELAKCLSA